jgi:hypothetical protein
MKLPLPAFRFNLRAALLVVAAMGCFLGWRLWDFEKSTVAAIERARGKVYFHYQNPRERTRWVSHSNYHTSPYLEDIHIDAGPRRQLPPPTLRDVICGNGVARHVAVVEIPLERLTPELASRLKWLADLKVILVRLQNGSRFEPDSSDGRRIDELREDFGERVHPTYWK